MSSVNRLLLQVASALGGCSGLTPASVNTMPCAHCSLSSVACTATEFQLPEREIDTYESLHCDFVSRGENLKQRLVEPPPDKNLRLISGSTGA